MNVLEFGVIFSNVREGRQKKEIHFLKFPVFGMRSWPIDHVLNVVLFFISTLTFVVCRALFLVAQYYQSLMDITKLAMANR